MTKQPDKSETLRIVSTQGGYAVFIFPSSQPAAVFTRGFDLLDWVAGRIADWEVGRRGEDAVLEPAADPAGGADPETVPVDA